MPFNHVEKSENCFWNENCNANQYRLLNLILKNKRINGTGFICWHNSIMTLTWSYTSMLKLNRSTDYGYRSSTVKPGTQSCQIMRSEQGSWNSVRQFEIKRLLPGSSKSVYWRITSTFKNFSVLEHFKGNFFGS